MSQPRGLGRGFDSLIPTDVTEVADPTAPAKPAAGGESIHLLDVASVHPNPHQPRTQFDDEALQNLADSIKEHGVLQPIVVSDRGDGKYELVAGERRLRASKLAGQTTIPAIVRGFEPQQKLELALIENVQRANLNPLETAAAYRRLMDEFRLTLDQIGQRVGKAKSTVANSLRLLQLPKEAQDAIAAGKMSEAHGRAILAVDRAAAQQLINHILNDGWSVRQAEAFARQQSAKPVVKQRAQVPAATSVLASQLGDYLHAAINVQPARKGGKLIISYKDDAELIRIARQIKPS